MTNALTEQSEWTLTYDYGEGQLQWDTNHELWAAWAMLEGVFRGMNVAGTDIPMYVRRNYENRVCVRCNSSGLTIYEGMLGSLARIALEERQDGESQDEKRSTPTQGRGTR